MGCGKVERDSINTMAGLLEGTGHCQLLSGRQVKRTVSEKGMRKYTGMSPEHSGWSLSEVTPQSCVLRSIGLGRPRVCCLSENSALGGQLSSALHKQPRATCGSQPFHRGHNYRIT